MERASRRLLIVLCLAMAGGRPAQAETPSPDPDPGTRAILPPDCEAVPIRSVERASIERGAQPKLVAHGTAATAGWTNPQLRFRSITKFRSRDASAVYAFVACPPGSGAEMLTPITAEALWNLSPQLGRVYHVVVEAETNTITLDPDKQ